jgi:membrane associated rhomboid family serine protease/nucleotide-binding universal stress UspA family protein
MFVHGSLTHVGFNMLYLLAFGDNVEDRLGWSAFLGFYLLAGLGSALAQLVVDPASSIATVGASGAIAGVLAAYIVLFPKGRVRVFFFLGPLSRTTRLSALVFVGVWFVTQFFNGVASLGVATAETSGVPYWAHIGGFAGGLVLAFLYRCFRDRSSGDAAVVSRGSSEEVIVTSLRPWTAVRNNDSNRRGRSQHTGMMGLANPATAPSLLQTGATIARARKAQLVLLQVVSATEQKPERQRLEVAKQQRYLETLVQEAGITGVAVTSMARSASSPAEGLLQAVHDVQADLLLLGWTGGRREAADDVDPVLDPVIRTAPCDVAVMHGTLPEVTETALVPVAGGRHARTVLELAQNLVDPVARRVIAVHYLRGEPSSRRELQTEALLQDAVGSLATAENEEVSAALVFLLLGFRPTHSERRRRLQRGLLASLVVMVTMCSRRAAVS